MKSVKDKHITFTAQETSASLVLRREEPADYFAVENLTREAFWEGFWGEGQTICDEHLLVDKLRKCPSFVPELDFVAELGGVLAGHIIFTRCKVVDRSGESHEALTFGPLSVLPAYQNKGIGKALMLHTFGVARQLRYKAVIIFGHSDYYPRFGFSPAARYGITTPEGNNYEAFMAYPLYPNALEGIQGKYYADPVYESLTQEEALEFDKKFPLKEKHTPEPIETLLNRLNPAARASLTKNQNLRTINQMTAYSQRTLEAMDGMDDEAIMAVKNTMAKFGMKWGR